LAWSMPLGRPVPATQRPRRICPARSRPWDRVRWRPILSGTRFMCPSAIPPPLRLATFAALMVATIPRDASPYSLSCQGPTIRDPASSRAGRSQIVLRRGIRTESLERDWGSRCPQGRSVSPPLRRELPPQLGMAFQAQRGPHGASRYGSAPSLASLYPQGVAERLPPAPAPPTTSTC